MSIVAPEEPRLIYQAKTAEIWHANSLNPEHVALVMRERIANLLCVDAPYSDRTHTGHKRGKMTADRAAAFGASEGGKSRKRERAYAARKGAVGESGRRDIPYAAWSSNDVDSFVETWAPRLNGWFVSITDDVLAPAWRSAFEIENLYPFAPLPLVETGSRCRMTGDGPSNWTCWVVVARPRNREFSRWGTTRGAYIQPAEREINSEHGTERIVGGKPKESMGAIVRDYSRDGDLVVDPACGAGTTGLAAVSLGRLFIGVDVDIANCELSARRLERAEKQVVLPFSSVPRAKFSQPSLLDHLGAAQ